MPALGTRVHSERATALLFYFLILFRVEEGRDDIFKNYIEDNILIAAFKF